MISIHKVFKSYVMNLSCFCMTGVHFETLFKIQKLFKLRTLSPLINIMNTTIYILYVLISICEESVSCKTFIRPYLSTMLYKRGGPIQFMSYKLLLLNVYFSNILHTGILLGFCTY